MGHSPADRCGGTVAVLRHLLSHAGGPFAEGWSMKFLRYQGVRALLVLSALASSAVVLEAGRRWGF